MTSATLADRIRAHFRWCRDALAALEDASAMTHGDMRVGGVPAVCGAVAEAYERNGLAPSDVVPMLRTEAESRVIEAARKLGEALVEEHGVTDAADENEAIRIEVRVGNARAAMDNAAEALAGAE